MKRRSRYGLIAASALIALSSLSPIAAEAAVTKITYSNWQFAEPGRGDALRAIVEEFNATHSTIKVEPVSIPYATYSTAILTQMGAKSGPDVVTLDYDVLIKAQAAGLVADITGKVITPASGFAAYDSKFNIGGKRYGIPWETLGYALICNKALLAAAGAKFPTTFEEFVATVKATTKGTDQYGFAMRNTTQQETGWWFDLSNWTYGFGGSWTDSKGNPTINSAENLKGVTEYAKFYDAKYIPQGADATTYRRMTWEGKVACNIDNGAVPTIFSDSNPAIKANLQVGRTPFPFAKNAQILIGTSVNAASTKQQASIKFINWLLQGTIQKKLQVAMGSGSLATKTLPAASIIQDKPWLKVYSKVADNGVLILPIGGELKTAEIRKAVISQVDKVLRSNLSPKDALDAAQAEVKTILGK
jgi:multiple sugar transport system substrate-binding protein